MSNTTDSTAACAAVETSSDIPSPSSSENARAPKISDGFILNFSILVLGFGLCRAWIIFCLGAPLISPDAAPSHWLYLASGALCSLVVALLCRRSSAPLSRMRTVLFRLTPVALAISGALILLALPLQSELLLAVGFIIGGLGAGPLQVLWGDRFSYHSVEFATFAPPAAAIVTAVVVALSAAHASFMSFIVVPLLSFGLLLFHGRRTGAPWGPTAEQPDEGDESMADARAASADAVAAIQQDAPLAPSSREDAPARVRRRSMPLGIGKLMFSIMVFSLLCRMFDTVPTGPDPLEVFGGSAVFSLIVVGIVFLAIVSKVRERFNPSTIYRLSLPIMVAGYVAIALFFDTHGFASVLIINIGYEFFDILTWVLFVDAARRPGENALHIFGLGVAFMFCGMALGNWGSHLVDSLIVSGSLQTNVVAMAAILGLVIVAFLVLPEGTLSQLSGSRREARREKSAEATNLPAAEDTAETAPEADAPTAGRIEQHCAAVARDFGLTPRESEVIVLLAYGRTLAIIARDLHIAQGTARTHIENIYRKLDVHKQQELIDLVDSYEG